MSTEISSFKIAKLRLRAGDRLVIKVNGRITQEMATRLKKDVEPQLPEGVRAFVIDQEIDLAVLTFEEIEKRSKLAT